MPLQLDGSFPGMKIGPRWDGSPCIGGLSSCTPNKDSRHAPVHPIRSNAKTARRGQCCLSGQPVRRRLLEVSPGVIIRSLRTTAPWFDRAIAAAKRPWSPENDEHFVGAQSPPPSGRGSYLRADPVQSRVAKRIGVVGWF